MEQDTRRTPGGQTKAEYVLLYTKDRKYCVNCGTFARVRRPQTEPEIRSCACGYIEDEASTEARLAVALEDFNNIAR